MVRAYGFLGLLLLFPFLSAASVDDGGVLCPNVAAGGGLEAQVSTGIIVYPDAPWTGITFVAADGSRHYFGNDVRIEPGRFYLLRANFPEGVLSPFVDPSRDPWARPTVDNPNPITGITAHLTTRYGRNMEPQNTITFDVVAWRRPHAFAGPHDEMHPTLRYTRFQCPEGLHLPQRFLSALQRRYDCRAVFEPPDELGPRPDWMPW